MTARQLKTYLIYNGLTSKTTLQSIYKASKLVFEYSQKLNDDLQEGAKAFFPDLLGIAVKRTLPKANFSDPKANTLGNFFLSPSMVLTYIQTCSYYVIFYWQNFFHLRMTNTILRAFV